MNFVTRNDLLVKTLGLAPFSFQSETLINKISRQKATTDILMAHGLSVVCAHDVFEQFFRWTLVASVDPSVKTQRNALQTIKMANKDVYSFSSDACADKMPMCSFDFCVCYLHMQMQTLCRAVEISITTSYSTSVKIF